MGVNTQVMDDISNKETLHLKSLKIVSHKRKIEEKDNKKSDSLEEKDNIVLIEREITIINGEPFYRSSGQFSHAGGTWAPFAGMQDFKSSFYHKCKNQSDDVSAHIGLHGQVGWLVKPGSGGGCTYRRDHFPRSKVGQKILDLGFNKEISSLYKRFTHVHHLLYSSVLGGGVWDTEIGRKFKEFLKEEYPEFYLNNQFTSINLESEKTVFISKALKEHVELDKIDVLPKDCDKNVNPNYLKEVNAWLEKHELNGQICKPRLMHKQIVNPKDKIYGPKLKQALVVEPLVFREQSSSSSSGETKSTTSSFSASLA